MIKNVYKFKTNTLITRGYIKNTVFHCAECMVCVRLLEYNDNNSPTIFYLLKTGCSKTFAVANLIMFVIYARAPNKTYPVMFFYMTTPQKYTLVYKWASIEFK